MRYVLGMAVAVVALAQPSAVLDDLEARAVRALSGIPRAESWPAAQSSRENVRTQIERAIGLQSAPGDRAISAFVYAPKNTPGRAPAVIIVRPHPGAADNGAALLPTVLAQLGMLAVEFDVRSDHSAMDQFGERVTPQALIQLDVRSVLASLQANPSVDTTRLALVGEGLAGTIGAAINAEISAAVVLHGAPDFLSMVKELRESNASGFRIRASSYPDFCGMPRQRRYWR
jgi:hypothetical protein